MKKIISEYSLKINLILGIILIITSYFDLINFKFWGIYLLINSLFSFGLFLINGNPLWVGFGGFDYAMEKLFKENYKKYVNLSMSIICFTLGIGILFM